MARPAHREGLCGIDTLRAEGGDCMFADIFRMLALPFAVRPGYREERS